MTTKPKKAVKSSIAKKQPEQTEQAMQASQPNKAVQTKQTDRVNKDAVSKTQPKEIVVGSTKTDTTAVELPVTPKTPSWFTEQIVTRIIAVTALVIASGSLLYIANIERKGGILMNSARAMMSKAGIVEDGSSLVAPDKATLLSSIQYLSSAARGSKPFSTELAVTYKMVGEHPEISKVLDNILPGAENGVPSVEDITTSYAVTISEIYGYGPGQLLGQAASSISSIVGITTSGRRRQAIIEEVTVHVAAGRLSQALQGLEKLDEQSKMPFVAWRTQAQRRVALDAAVSEIKRIAFLSILDGAS